MIYNQGNDIWEVVAMQLFEDRHALHRIPELSHDLPRTVAGVFSGGKRGLRLV